MINYQVSRVLETSKKAVNLLINSGFPESLEKYLWIKIKCSTATCTSWQNVPFESC